MISPQPHDNRELKIAPRPASDFAAEASITGWRCWIFATTGIVVMLLLVQFISGLLLAFYYVPSIDHAHTTVSFIEKVLPSGSWLRSLHHHGSQWLPLFLFLHVVQLFWRRVYRTRVERWLAAVVLLALVMAGGATGYSLPWDVRAFFSTRVAEGLLGGLPLIGVRARDWLLGGGEISTLTLSRFYALHVLVTPFLILMVIGWQLFRFQRNRTYATEDNDSASEHDAATRGSATRDARRSNRSAFNQVSRNVLLASLLFLVLGLYCYKFPAPLGPSASLASAEYLPRPGIQFLWLYQTLKYVPGALGSLVGIVLPGLFFLVLAALPWLNRTPLRRFTSRPRYHTGAAVLFLSFVFVITLTALAYFSDRRNPRTRQQVARQAADEAAFRQQPFVPTLLKEDDGVSGPTVSPATSSAVGPPAAYTKMCATCHGEHGEGARQGPLKFPPLLGVSAKPRRSIEDIIALLNDPKAYGLEPPMKSFATKLTDQEKREIAEWVVKLKK
jgi:ubiquinol-cytochrome c reductase cytochrome b subunit